MKCLAWLLLPVIAILLHPLNLCAQQQNLKFQHIGTGDGLSHSNVISILRDSRGFMWFGTRDGLNRYDGYSFKVYRNDPQDPHSISGNTILSMKEDANGYIWIATWGGGLNRFDRWSETFERFTHVPADPASIGSNLLNTLLFDQAGKLWIGTEDAGLDLFDPVSKKFQHITDAPQTKALRHASIKALHFDTNNELWIGTNENGLHRFDVVNKTLNSFYHDPSDIKSISSNAVKVIYTDHDGRLWIGTRGAGLNEYHRTTSSFTAYRYLADKNSIAHDNIVAITEDQSGNLWIGTENGGLSLLDKTRKFFTTYKQDDIDPLSLSSNSVWAIYKDSNNDMWVGTYSGNINFWSGANNRFVHFRHTSIPGSLSHNKVLSIFEDSRKTIWIGTDGGGLNRFDERKYTFDHFLHKQGDQSSIGGNYVLSIAEDAQGNIWIGTWGDGISVMDPTGRCIRHFKNDPRNDRSLGSNNAYGIYRDSKNRMWVGTYYGGLNLYDPKTNSFIRFMHDEKNVASISSNRINSVVEDTKGNIWVSTDGSGLDRYDENTGRFIHYAHHETQNSISNNNVSKIIEDEKNNLWIGTMSGLNYLDTRTGKFTVYRMAQGLPNDAIFGMQVDEHKNIWIGTNKGLSKFNPAMKSFTNFTRSDGLQSDEFKLNAVCRSSIGQMYFGGNNGFNSFRADEEKVSAVDPPLVMSEFLISNQPVAITRDPKNPTPLFRHIAETKNIELPYSGNVISFEFTALHYRPGQEKEYSYWLEGFDREWNNIGTKRTATYTDLDPGEYVLHVRARTIGNAWSTNQLKVSLTIVPPFYMTWWFRTLCVLLIVSLTVFFYRHRIRLIRQQKIKLQEQVDRQTRELQVLNRQEYEARIEAEKARQEADEANRAKSVFLATMSHEIRTPMNGVIGMAALLEEQNLTDEQRHYASTIAQCGESLLKVINDILDFSKIESGNMELESHTFDLRQVIEEVLEVFAGKLAHADLELMYTIGANVPAYVCGDSHRLRQILLNLVGNALKFTHKGQVLIEASTSPAAGNELRLQFNVRDTGIGIPQDKVERLFKAFTQVDSSTTRKYGGTGLGLVICQKLVEMMGGEITVTSEVGTGTCFSFSILTKESQSAPSREMVFDADSLADKVILVVDDNDTNRTILKNQLEKLSGVCVLAESGYKALELLKTGPKFDLVLTDMQMPGMDGVELSKEISQFDSTLPIIILTSLGEDLSLKHPGLFRSMLIKPVKQHILYRHVLKELEIQTLQQVEARKNTAVLTEDFAKKYPMKILLAEDNAINQLLAITILNKLGYAATVANHGQEAVDHLKAELFDLVFMDMQMPEMDGLEATRYIRSEMQFQPIIVAMTANAMQSDREACLEAGMDDYLSKPVKPEDVMRMIEKWSASCRESKSA